MGHGPRRRRHRSTSGRCKTDREEALEIGDHRIIVLDPLNRVSPTFSDPSLPKSLAIIFVALLFATVATTIPLYLIDNGEIKAALTGRIQGNEPA